MTETVISVRQVGKQYLLFKKPQDRLKHALAWRFGKTYGRPFWALHKVSFDIKRGESVGIIGRNGSGKSTLLQILAGTLQPTLGEARITGRVGALLELGSGFNPEYTGRENVWLNGVVLGLSPAELKAQFEKIAEFADIGEFMDQPVKLYSSGMVMRLAFAVQAIVPKDILIVDEALAVGDEAFQRKCYARLDEFRDQGGTILLVSHNTQAIVRQCDRCLFLHAGQLLLDGPSKPVTDLYQRYLYGSPQQRAVLVTLLQEQNGTLEALLNQLELGAQSPPDQTGDKPARTGEFVDATLPRPTPVVYGNGAAEIFGWGMWDAEGQPVNVVVTGQRYFWRYRVRFHQAVQHVNFGVLIRTIDGLEVAGTNNFLEGQHYDPFTANTVVELTFRLRLNLAPGTYYLTSGVAGQPEASSEQVYLHRLMDLYTIRIVTPDRRSIYGLAFVEPALALRYIEPVDDLRGSSPQPSTPK